jgi:hypothetical protein
MLAILALGLFAIGHPVDAEEVEYKSVNKATIDYYEGLIRAGDWNNGLPYFDEHTAPDELTEAAAGISWERYLFTRADVHLKRATMFKDIDTIRSHAAKAEEACLAYITWYSQLKETQTAWLPEVKATKFPDDVPLTRGRIRHILGLLVEAILTSGEPQRVSSALADLEPIWFGADAISGWIRALGYRFSDEKPWPASDFERIRQNLERPTWSELVETFVSKVDVIAKKRDDLKTKPLRTTWLKLRTDLSKELAAKR